MKLITYLIFLIPFLSFDFVQPDIIKKSHSESQLNYDFGIVSKNHWNYGSGVGSKDYWNYGSGVGSKDYWNYGSGIGSKDHWNYGSGLGSKDHWNYGSGVGSKNHWNYGSGVGSKNHWNYGSGRTFVENKFIDLYVGLISDDIDLPEGFNEFMNTILVEFPYIYEIIDSL